MPKLRALWEHKLNSCEVAEDKWLNLKYDNTATEYLARYTFLLEKNASKQKTFLVVEDVVINRGLQNVKRHYLLEEIQNKDGLLRVSLYSKVNN